MPLQTIIPPAIMAGKVLLYRFPQQHKGGFPQQGESEEFAPSSIASPVTDPAWWEGRYTLCPMRLRLEDGATKDLQDAVVAMTRSKNIVTTQVVGMSGTVKEYISNGDYDINIAVGIQGLEDGKIADIYPEEGLRDLLRYMEVDKPIQVQSAFFDIFRINRIVIKSFSLTQDTASNYQELTISALSDDEYNVYSTNY